MWVVKLGGSLSTDPLLAEWLGLVAQLGGGRITVVGGGAGFAEHVREVQRHWRFDDLPAHNMAVLAMAQTAYQMNAINPALRLTTSQADILRVLRQGHAAIWLPFEWQRQKADATTNWDVTSDSIALDLARRLNAERLVVVKSCAIDPARSLAQLCTDGILDRHFCQLASDAAFPIDVMQKDQLEGMRALLLGQA